ncbi:MAG TPA: hypothetical protein VHH11_14875 [Gammaproteobacteria bacterium]|nr:hypothetical protein [Gammaproteobacteria bacterium]
MLTRAVALSVSLAVAGGAFAQGQPPPPPAPACTRAELKAATEAYVAAQTSGDASNMAFADKAVYRENMADVAKGDGLWNKALPIALSRSFLDPVRCKTFTEVIVTQGGHPYVIGTRLYVDQRKITRIDSLVTDKGDWLFNANAYLKYSSAEDWSPPKKSARASGQELINAANSYLDQFSDKFVKTPWGRPCARLEGGAYTNRDGKKDASCEVGIPPGVLYIVNRDYVVDEEQGVINVFCRFGNSSTGMPDSHTFRLVNGKLANVHTLSVNLNPNQPSPQADDNGAIIR